VVQSGEYLLCKHEALSSNSSPIKKERKKEKEMACKYFPQELQMTFDSGRGR
jgi:hypothetical protein